MVLIILYFLVNVFVLSSSGYEKKNYGCDTAGYKGYNKNVKFQSPAHVSITKLTLEAHNVLGGIFVSFGNIWLS